MNTDATDKMHAKYQQSKQDSEKVKAQSKEMASKALMDMTDE
jgi:hypothetical protein